MVARETSSPGEAPQTLAEALATAGVDASSEAIARLSRFQDLLKDRAIPLGLLGPSEADRIVPRHILESAALAPLLGREDRLADVGSGAGLPGLVLACLGWHVVLIETLARRAAFLEEAIGELGVSAVVHQIRAEDAGRGELRESFDVVMCRALALPTVALELCLPLARTGGRLVIPATPEPEDDETLGRVADELGGWPPRWENLLVPGAERPRCVMIVDKFRSTPDRFPRRPGVPKKRPLG